MRWTTTILALLLSGVLLAVIDGCAGGDDDSDEWGDAGPDVDTDGDTDVDIEYPEYISPYLDFQSLMTGPISPPPEHTDELESLDEPNDAEDDTDGDGPTADYEDEPGGD